MSACCPIMPPGDLLSHQGGRGVEFARTSGFFSTAFVREMTGLGHTCKVSGDGKNPVFSLEMHGLNALGECDRLWA